MTQSSKLLYGTACALILSGAASAQTYVSGSAGFNFQNDSDNAGALTRDFATGDGVAVPPGTILPASTDIAWTTEFETGSFLAGALGYRYNDAWRAELEISRTTADVDTHMDVTAGGGAIGAADAAVLITSSAPLGVTVADLVADGQGDITTTAYAVNGYYDFTVQDLPVGFYAGLGVGLAEVKVDYSPSGVAVIDDTEMVSLFQVMLGGTYPVSDTMEAFGGYRYRMTGDAETNSVLFPTSLDVENNSHVIEAGVRFYF